MDVVLKLSDEQVTKLAEALPRQETEPRWLDVKAAARYLSRTEPAIRSLIKRGKLTPSRMDGKIMLDRFEIDALMEKHKAG